MLNRLILHIGMGKTGSSTIQEFLHRNHRQLRRDRILALGPDDVTPCPQRRVADTERLMTAIGRVKARIGKTGAETLLWSLEGFGTKQFLIDPARIEALRTEFPARAVRVVVYLRRQDLFAKSAYIQWNVLDKSYNGPVRSFDERFPCLYGEPDGTPIEQTNLNYYEVVRPWADTFGREQLRVRPLETSQLAGGDLLTDFIAAAGLPERPYNVDIPPQNTMLHREFTDLMGMYSSLFEGPVSDTGLQFFLRAVQEDKLFSQPTFTPFELPPSTRVRIIDACAGFNGRVAREFLAREDGDLFRDPWPDPDAPYREAPPIGPDKYVPMLLHIMKKQHMQISFLMAERRRERERSVRGRLARLWDRRLAPIARRLRGR